MNSRIFNKIKNYGTGTVTTVQVRTYGTQYAIHRLRPFSFDSSTIPEVQKSRENKLAKLSEATNPFADAKVSAHKLYL